MQDLHVDIWSDVACPWCYIGKRRFEAALAQFPFRDHVTVRWHSFELDPNAPAQSEGTMVEVLAKKYRISKLQAMGMMSNVAKVAASEGLDYRLEQAQMGNTFDAHRLLHFAEQHGKQDVMKERLLKAYFTDGRSVSDHDSLAALAAEVGLDAEAVRAMLASSEFADAVRADEQQAAATQIQGVPFFVFNRKYGVSGAQETPSMLHALNSIWQAEQSLIMVNPTPAQPAAASADAAPNCDDGTCAI